jgi:CMP-N-acetylneuraminic acid synthetase
VSHLAIIPARGGSQGLPRKNVLPLAGKPLVAWSIEAARAAREVHRVVVSTDDDEIARVSERFGAEVVRRPPAISGNEASSESALLHALEHLQATEGYRPELTIFLQCTSPLTAGADIDGTVHALREQAADTALAVVDFHYFVWRRDGADAVGVNHDKRVRMRRQEREPQFLEAGAVYVMKTEGFLAAKHRFFGTTALYSMPADRRLEIDDDVDLGVAEAMMAMRRSNNTEVERDV